MIILENDCLVVSIAHHGAEVRGVFDKRLNKERMWSGDANYWGRVSPVLFPIVGRVKGGSYKIDDESYSLSQHGFLRDQDFELESQTETKVVFVFKSNGKLQEKYPYEHEVRIGYELIEDELKVIWDVKNVDSRKMYYSIGAHPAFLLDPEGSYTFELKGTEDSKFITLKEGYVDQSNDYDINEVITVDHENFKSDARIYSHLNQVVLDNKLGKDVIRLECEGFDFVGLWSATQHGHLAPFICIEPWLGITDAYEGKGNFKEKLAIKSLESGKNSETFYTVQFGIKG